MKVLTTQELLDNLTEFSKKPLSKTVEPALDIGSKISPILGTIITLLYLVPDHYINDGTVAYIFSIVAVLIPLVTAYLIRRKVWSPHSVARVIAEAEVIIQEFEKVVPKIKEKHLEELNYPTPPYKNPHKKF